MKKTFLNCEKPLLTTMVMSKNADRAVEIAQKVKKIGTDAFGIQIDQLPREEHNEKTYRRIFEAMGDHPIYVTDYRRPHNSPGDDILAAEMHEIARSGATLCDVQGDMFEPHPEQVCMGKEAIYKQMKYIESLKNAGAEVLMSSHLTKFAPAEEIIRIANEHIKRGADVVKIVSISATEEQLYENIRINGILKHEIDHPYLFLSGGAFSHLHRRIGFALGSCMCLCSVIDDEYRVKMQPELSKMKEIVKNFN